MQVVILAGGLGTRLRPITENVPKPMVEVAGRPFLEYIVTHLSDQGFKRFLFLVGYLGDQIQAYFRSGSRWGIAIEYATEAQPLGTAGAIRNALEQLDSEFLLVYGDSYLPINYLDVVQAFHAVSSKCLMVIYDNYISDTGVVNNVALDKNETVQRYEKGHSAPDLQYVEAGVLCLRREVFEVLPHLQNISLETDLYEKLISQHEMRAFVTKQRFFDIGTPERLEEFVMRKP